MSIMAAGRVLNRVPDLMEEAGTDAMDLVRDAGLGISTAYRLADRNQEVRGIRYSTIKKLCSYFTNLLDREITPDDLMWAAE